MGFALLSANSSDSRSGMASAEACRLAILGAKSREKTGAGSHREAHAPKNCVTTSSVSSDSKVSSGGALRRME